MKQSISFFPSHYFDFSCRLYKLCFHIINNICFYSQKLCYFRRGAVPAGRQGSPERLVKILKTFIHGLSVEAGSRHSRASRLPSKAGSSD
jgi:hypothetical protein